MSVVSMKKVVTESATTIKKQDDDEQLRAFLIVAYPTLIGQKQ